MGSRAAKGAAQTQQLAAQQQAAEFQRMLAQYNPQIGAAAEQARSDVFGASNQAFEALTAATQGAGARLTDVAERGATDITGAAGQANEYLAPYLGLGGQAAQSLAEYMAPGGQLNRNFTFEDMQQLDPGYQFRLDQANRALAGSAAARGGALGGGAIRAAQNLSQNLASSEYGAAFDRFRAQNADRYGRFSNLLDLGVRTGGLVGQNLMSAAQQAAALRTGAAQTGGGWDIGAAQTAGGWNIGANQYGGNALMSAAQQQAQNALYSQRSIADLMTGGANAQAAGQVGSANAWMQGLGQISNAANRVGDYYQQKDIADAYGYGGGGYGGWSPTGSPNGYYVGGNYIPGLPNPGILPPPETRSYPMGAGSYQNPALISRYAPRLRYGANR